MMDEIKRFLNGEEVDVTDELASYICRKLNMNGSVYSYYRYTCGHTEFVRAWYISELDYRDEDEIIYHSYAKIDGHENVYMYISVTGPCPKCEEEQWQHALEEEEGKIVKSYGYKPKEWIITNPSGTDRLFGVELECEFNNIDDAGGASVELNTHCNRVLLKRDGSLKAPGFESITHPADYRSAVELLSGVCRWLNFFDGDTSLDCGMHVHVSRAAFQPMAISNLIVLVDNVWDELYKFSRRDQDELRWCSNRLEHMAGASKVTKKQEADEAATECQHDDRYHAVNVINKDTVEFRIFKGTIDVNQVIANLQLVDVLVDLANSKDGFDVEWQDVIRHAAMCGYEEFLEKEFEINEAKKDEFEKEWNEFVDSQLVEVPEF